MVMSHLGICQFSIKELGTLDPPQQHRHLRGQPLRRRNDFDATGSFDQTVRSGNVYAPCG